MKTRTAKLRDIEQVGFPIVKAAFKGKDGNMYVGAMMVDSGSVYCILNKSILSLNDESCVVDGKTMEIHSVQGKGVKCQSVSFNFKIGCGEYTATDISFKGNSAAGAMVRATPPVTSTSNFGARAKR